MKRRVALALIAPATAACVVWPAGSGPMAGPVAATDALSLQERGLAVILDVRSREAYVAGHIPGALHFDAAEIGDRAAEIRRLGRTAILYCAWPNEATSARAALTLQAKGIDARVLADGLGGFWATGRPLATGPNP